MEYQYYVICAEQDAPTVLRSNTKAEAINTAHTMSRYDEKVYVVAETLGTAVPMTTSTRYRDVGGSRVNTHQWSDYSSLRSSLRRANSRGK